jgi:hypothetical protein
MTDPGVVRERLRIALFYAICGFLCQLGFRRVLGKFGSPLLQTPPATIEKEKNRRPGGRETRRRKKYIPFKHL